jgi:GT2 family glycosyltransferase/glycosyltransferase involved in cell wall biosynthesis
MWPLDLPAREVLKLPGDTVIPWAVMDTGWYLRSHPDVVGIVGDDDPSGVLKYYLEIGQKQGHSPNRLFDETWHRLRYPHIAERVEAGHWRSAFDAYCRRGALDRSPHWLFDELGYRDRYQDLSPRVLAEYEMHNGYDHYLRHGSHEDRIGHVLFDPAVYLSHFDPADIDAIRAEGVFQHYLRRIESAEPELRTSIYFDPDWYHRRYPEVSRSIETKRWKCALHHYLCNDTPTAFDPLEGFSETWYLERDPGLMAVIASGSFRNGYMHFLRFGATELRQPNAAIDLAWYAAQPSVRADLEHGRAPDAFAHWLTIGASGGLRAAKPETESITAAQARHLFQQAARTMLPIAGRFGIHFECRGEPALSVVMVVRDGFATTMATIASLRCNSPADIELIIVDLGSADETRAIGRYVPGAKVVRFDTDIGWSRAADAGRQFAAAGAVLFLSGAAQIAPGSIDRACTRLATDASVGAIGGMILQAHGVVAAAGGIVWNSGGTHDYQRGGSALDGEANFVRVVDFCSAAFLLVRAALLSQLDGFDHDCINGYETVDLCLRIAEAGLSVVYDPSAMITIGDAIDSPDDSPDDSLGGSPNGPLGTSRDGHAAYFPSGGPPDHFKRKHAAALTSRFAPGGPVQVFARHSGAKPHRILFIEDTVPLRRTGSGFVRSNDLVRIMAGLGCAVTVFPVNGSDHGLALVFGDMADTVEVMHTLAVDRLAAFLTARAGYYDTVWVARTHNLIRVQPILARSVADGTLRARIVLDTEAVTPQREAMQAALTGAPYDLDAAMAAIRADASICQQTVAVTEAEAETLQECGFPAVQVIGHAIRPQPGTPAFARRAGMLFVGAIHKQDSPNFDSLVWFVDAVLPLVEAELKWETRLTIAGYVAPGVDLSRFAHHPRITLRGPVADLAPLYNASRVFVAPTRYAAGAPYKVLEAAANGLPVVATEVLRSELGWRSGQEILAAEADDPVAFAAGIVTLYRNDAVWRSVRDGALRRVRADHDEADFIRSVASVLLLPAPADLLQL